MQANIRYGEILTTIKSVSNDINILKYSQASFWSPHGNFLAITNFIMYIRQTLSLCLYNEYAIKILYVIHNTYSLL